MAGVKGRSGGPRKNSGGKRPGAGAKKKPAVLIPEVPGGDEPESIRQMRAIMRDTSLDAKLRLEAAKALAPFEAARKGEGGKKGERAEKAKGAASRFKTAPPPLKAIRGGRA